MLHGCVQDFRAVGFVEHAEHRRRRGILLENDVVGTHRAVDGHRRDAHACRVVVAELQSEQGGIVVARHELVVHVLADEGELVALPLQALADDLVVVAWRHVVVLRLEVFHQRAAGVLRCHILRHTDDVERVGRRIGNLLVVHLRDAQLYVAALEAAEGHEERAGGDAAVDGFRQRDLLAVGLLALSRCHLNRADGLRTAVLQSHQAVGRLARYHHAVGGERGHDGHVVEFPLRVLDDEQDGQDASVAHVHPSRIAFGVVVAVHPEVAAVLHVVRIERGDGADVLLQRSREAHHQLFHIVGNHIVGHRHRVPARVAVAIAVANGSRARREVFAVEVGPDEAFVFALHLTRVPAHAHTLNGTAGIRGDHFLREQDGTSHLRVVVERQAVVLPYLVVELRITHIEFS